MNKSPWRPSHEDIILTHWEDFFRLQDRRLKGIPFAKVHRVLEAVEKAAPDETTLIPPRAG